MKLDTYVKCVSPNCYCIVKLWLNDTAVDEHKHMGGENMLEPRKHLEIIKTNVLHYVVGLLIP